LQEHAEKDLEALLDLARYAFLRLDGAWFIAAAEKCGVETATDLDIRAWEMFSERLAKKNRVKNEYTGELLPSFAKVAGNTELFDEHEWGNYML